MLHHMGESFITPVGGRPKLITLQQLPCNKSSC